MESQPSPTMSVVTLEANQAILNIHSVKRTLHPTDHQNPRTDESKNIRTTLSMPVIFPLFAHFNFINFFLYDPDLLHFNSFPNDQHFLFEEQPARSTSLQALPGSWELQLFFHGWSDARLGWSEVPSAWLAERERDGWKLVNSIISTYFNISTLSLFLLQIILVIFDNVL